MVNQINNGLVDINLTSFRQRADSWTRGEHDGYSRSTTAVPLCSTLLSQHLRGIEPFPSYHHPSNLKKKKSHFRISLTASSRTCRQFPQPHRREISSLAINCFKPANHVFKGNAATTHTDTNRASYVQRDPDLIWSGRRRRRRLD